MLQLVGSGGAIHSTEQLIPPLPPPTLSIRNYAPSEIPAMKQWPLKKPIRRQGGVCVTAQFALLLSPWLLDLPPLELPGHWDPTIQRTLSFPFPFSLHGINLKYSSTDIICGFCRSSTLTPKHCAESTFSVDSQRQLSNKVDSHLLVWLFRVGCSGVFWRENHWYIKYEITSCCAFPVELGFLPVPTVSGSSLSLLWNCFYTFSSSQTVQ